MTSYKITTGLNAMMERFLIPYGREWAPDPPWEESTSLLTVPGPLPVRTVELHPRHVLQAGKVRVSGSRNCKKVSVTQWQSREFEMEEGCGLCGGWRENSWAGPDKANFPEAFSLIWRPIERQQSI